MNILLINAVSPLVLDPAPPLGLLSIASFMQKEDYNRIKILDLPICSIKFDPLCTPEEVAVEQYLLKEIKDFKPDIVGISSFTEFSHITYAACKSAKIVDDEIKVVVGGPHATLAPKRILETIPFVDYVVRGEGEITFLELVKFLEGKQEIKAIQGISYLKDGKVCTNPNRPYIKNLDFLPPPAWELLPSIKSYLSKCYTKSSPVVIVGSRGCPFSCTFCASSKIWEHCWRPLSPERVIDQIRVFSEEYGIREIIFADDIFGVNKKRALKLCRLIKESNMEIKWWCMTRADAIDKELLINMRNAGCVEIGFGIESINENIRNNIYKKRLPTSQIKKAISLSQEMNFNLFLSFILSPYDSISTIKEHITFLKSIKPVYTRIHILKAYYGTAIRELLEKDGLLTPTPNNNLLIDLEMHGDLGLYPVDNRLCKIQKGLRNSYAGLLSYDYADKRLPIVASFISLLENIKENYFRNIADRKMTYIEQDSDLCKWDHEMSYKGLEFIVSNYNKIDRSLTVETVQNLMESFIANVI